MEHWWHDTDVGKPNCVEKNLPQCLYIHHKFEFKLCKTFKFLHHREQTLSLVQRQITLLFFGEVDRFNYAVRL